MALIIPPGYSQIAFEMRLTGDTEDMITTIGIDNNGVAVATIPDLMFEAFSSTLRLNMPTVYSFVGVTAYVGQDGSAPLVYTSSYSAVAGANPVNSLPPNCAALVRKRTDLAGRRGRGRMYLPGVSEDFVDAVGNIDSTGMGEFQDAVTNFFEWITDGVEQTATPPVVLHRSEGIGVEPLPTPITALTVDSKIATQRRRLRP